MTVHPEILDALTSGIQSEVATYVFYLEAAKKVKEEQIKQTLENLALEEKRHFQILERQYDSLIRSEKWITTADVLREEGLPEINEDMTSKHQDMVDEVRAAAGVRQVLQIALRLEEEARDLFANLMNKSDSPEAKATFESLSKFEQVHVEKITKMIASL
jgi:rubrerythrin